MLVLFRRHIGEDLRRVGMFLSQTFREIGIDPSIFFLAADGEREEFLLRKLIERFHIELSSCAALRPIGLGGIWVGREQ
jgi:hypothetical protein